MAAAELTFTPLVITGGTAKVDIKVRNGLSTWRLTQISVYMAGAPAGATCEVRKNGFLVSPVIPSGDTVSGEPPVILRPSDVVTVQWANCTVGAVGQVLVFYDDGES